MGIGYIDVYQIVLTCVTGAICFRNPNTRVVLGYQLLSILIPVSDSIVSWLLRLIMTTVLVYTVYRCRFKLNNIRLFLYLNSILITYIFLYILMYYYDYSSMLYLHNTNIDMYLEYLILLSLIRYKGLLSYVGTIGSRVKCWVFKFNRDNSLAYKEVNRGKRWI